VRAAGAAARVTVVAEQLALAAPAPLVLAAVRRVAVERQRVVAAADVGVGLPVSLAEPWLVLGEVHAPTFIAPFPAVLARDTGAAERHAVVAAGGDVVRAASMAWAHDSVACEGEYLAFFAELPVVLPAFLR
jgi:hypothetical protein